MGDQGEVLCVPRGQRGSEGVGVGGEHDVFASAVGRPLFRDLGGERPVAVGGMFVERQPLVAEFPELVQPVEAMCFLFGVGGCVKAEAQFRQDDGASDDLIFG